MGRKIEMQSRVFLKTAVFDQEDVLKFTKKQWPEHVSYIYRHKSTIRRNVSSEKGRLLSGNSSKSEQAISNFINNFYRFTNNLLNDSLMISQYSRHHYASRLHSYFNTVARSSRVRDYHHGFYPFTGTKTLVESQTRKF